MENVKSALVIFQCAMTVLAAVCMIAGLFEALVGWCREVGTVVFAGLMKGSSRERSQPIGQALRAANDE